MSDPAGIAAAARRSHLLLAEGHQPLVMTPGDLRTLLARYQHHLQELADAVEPITAVQGAGLDASFRDAGLVLRLPGPAPGDYHIQVRYGDCTHHPEQGATRDMHTRLTDLPYGHPSSPYHEDGSPKPPVLRLQDIGLPELAEGGQEEDTSQQDGPQQDGPASDQPQPRPQPRPQPFNDAEHARREQEENVSWATRSPT